MKVPALADLGAVNQLAYVPEDFDSALRFWTEDLGVGPFFVLEHVPFSKLTYQGQPSAADITVAFSYWGEVQIELITQHDASASVFKTFLDEGKSGVHHICMRVDDLGRARSLCEAIGAPIVQEASTAGAGEFLFADFSGRGPDCLVEIVRLEPALDDAFAQILLASQSWDGIDPIRSLPGF